MAAACRPKRWGRLAMLLRTGAILLGALLSQTGTAVANHTSSPEQAIKAAFIYNFTKFVSWPDSSHANPSAPFRICVSDDDAMVSVLGDTVRGKQVAGHAIVIVPVRDQRELAFCHVLFITHQAGDERGRFLSAVRGKPVLTVGEEKSFTARGGIINFFVANDRIQFEINIDSARRAGLTISSRLLSLARIVKETQP